MALFIIPFTLPLILAAADMHLCLTVTVKTQQWLGFAQMVPKQTDKQAWSSNVPSSQSCTAPTAVTCHAALSEGCPDGSEAVRLAEYEAEVQQYRRGHQAAQGRQREGASPLPASLCMPLLCLLP